MNRNSEDRLRAIARTVARCLKLAIGLTVAGLMGIVVFMVMIHIYDTHPRLYSAIAVLAAIFIFIGLTALLAKSENGEGEEALHDGLR